MEQPKCEICGEADASCQTLECGLCDDCFAAECREQLRSLLGDCCCDPSRQANGYLQICLAPQGVEHMHGD